MKVLPLFLAVWMRSAVGQDGVAPPLIVLTSLEPELARPIADRFRAENPAIDLELIEVESRVALERIRGEAIAKRVSASVWWGADDLELEEAAREGLLDRHEPAWGARIRETEKSAHSFWTGLYWVPITVTYKTGCQDLPKTYEDLASPRFRGRLLLHSPSESEATRRFLGVMFTTRFDNTTGVERPLDWTAMLYSNRVEDDELNDVKMVTHIVDKKNRGDELALLPAPVAVCARDLEGLDIQFSILTAAPSYLEGIARIAGAPNPAAAARFIEFAGRPEANVGAARRGHIPLGGDGGVALPVGLTTELGAELGDRERMISGLTGWMSEIEKRVNIGIVSLPEGEDSSLWIFNLIDAVGTVAIVAVLVVLFRKGKIKGLDAKTADAAPNVGPPGQAEVPDDSRP